MRRHSTDDKLYPYTADIKIGNGEVLSIQYRILYRGLWKKIRVAVEDDLKQLGLDPETDFNLVMGFFKGARVTTRFTGEDRQKFHRLQDKIAAVEVCGVLGAWTFVDADKHPVPITLETCLRLPPDLIWAILICVIKTSAETKQVSRKEVVIPPVGKWLH